MNLYHVITIYSSPLLIFNLFAVYNKKLHGKTDVTAMLFTWKILTRGQ